MHHRLFHFTQSIRRSAVFYLIRRGLWGTGVYILGRGALCKWRLAYNLLCALTKKKKNNTQNSPVLIFCKLYTTFIHLVHAILRHPEDNEKMVLLQTCDQLKLH